MEDTFNSKFAFSNRKIDLEVRVIPKEIGKFEVEAGVNYSKSSYIQNCQTLSKVSSKLRVLEQMYRLKEN